MWESPAGFPAFLVDRLQALALPSALARSFVMQTEQHCRFPAANDAADGPFGIARQDTKNFNGLLAFSSSGGNVISTDNVHFKTRVNRIRSVAVMRC